jgi:hypothetical protein
MQAQARTYLFIHLFIFKMLWARPWGISSWLKVPSNHNKDINTKNILFLRHVLRTKGVGGKNKSMEIIMLTGENTIEDWILKSRHSHWHGRLEKFFPHAQQNWGSHWYKYTPGILLAVVNKINNYETRDQKFSNYCSTQQDYETHLWYTKIH